jgi:uncharacterized protein (TIGR02453 family)
MDAFTGFTAEGLDFLRGLAANNDRDWFAENRATYDDKLKPQLAALIAVTSDEMAKRGVPLAGDPKASQFRLHRDTRFSKDKRPYKTHISGTLTRDGKRMSLGMAYIHIEPEPVGGFDPLALPDEPHGHGPFAAVGFYLDERSDIDAVRSAIAKDPAGWAKVEAALGKAGLRLDPGAPVKRLPKGFEDQAGSSVDDAIKRTRWIVSRPLTEAEVLSPDLPRIIAGFADDARPLLDFGWAALDKA